MGSVDHRVGVAHAVPEPAAFHVAESKCRPAVEYGPQGLARHPRCAGVVRLGGDGRGRQPRPQLVKIAICSLIRSFADIQAY